MWTYDNAGNILSRKEYAYTTGTVGTATDTVTYTYGDSSWGDLLTKYDGVAITYDDIGNPLTDGTWTYTWEHGRELASMTDGTTTWTYTYDANGMRTSRSNGSTTYKYVYNGSSLAQMTVGSNTLYFTSDTVNLNGTTYYYVTNLQGDVIAILNQQGIVVVEYVYDAWGNVVSTTGSMASTLGVLNPIRYRSYVYDQESGLYYLQSRYYDPEIGRFINADALVSTGQEILGNNMFAYCNNNPVMGFDPSGMVNWGGVLAGLVIGVIAVAAVAVTVATAGAASPLVAAAGTAIGSVASAALVEAAVVTTAGAVAETPVVYDVSTTCGYSRAGYSYVYDFATDTGEIYAHTGGQNKKEYGFTVGSGFVFNYDGLGSYAGEFYDVSYSANYHGTNLGLDFCTDPNNLNPSEPFQEGTTALLFTSGYSVSLGGSKTTFTYSYDYYHPVLCP